MSGSDQPTTTPAPVVGLAGTFDLGADPVALQEAARAVRALASAAASAGQIVTTAANTIEAEQTWLGDTAANYQHHRRRITGDLGSLGHEATHAADVLDEIAGLLIFYQVALDNERSAISHVPVQVSPAGDLAAMVVYQPRTEEEAGAVSAALARAADLRSGLAEDLALKEASMRRAVEGSSVGPSYARSPGLRMLAETWRPRTLRMVNLNIGEGDPTDADEMDEIAGIINRSDANVVTIQEVFREDLDDIRRHLDGEWEIYYANADNKRRPRSWSPENWAEDFGNAVLIRQGDGVSSRAVEEENRVVLDAPGSTYPGGRGPRPMPNIDPEYMVTETVDPHEIPLEYHGPDGEARVAAVAEITIDR